jgi:hypothetical protein
LGLNTSIVMRVMRTMKATITTTMPRRYHHLGSMRIAARARRGQRVASSMRADWSRACCWTCCSSARARSIGAVIAGVATSTCVLPGFASRAPGGRGRLGEQAHLLEQRASEQQDDHEREQEPDQSDPASLA